MVADEGRAREERAREVRARDGSASTRVADSLRASILGGEYPPGTRIRQEEVAANHDASRVPAREALRTLAAEGLVKLVANSGAWVARLSLEECVELYQMRERIEPLLLEYSLPRLREEEIEELRDLAVRIEHTEGVEDFLHLDRLLHLGCYAGASTSVLGETVVRLWNMTQHYRRAYTRTLDRNSNRIVHDEHNMLVTALADRDLEGAQTVLAGHIRRTRIGLAQHPEVFD